jgi:hypothetical protein
VTTTVLAILSQSGFVQSTAEAGGQGALVGLVLAATPFYAEQGESGFVLHSEPWAACHRTT